MKVWILILFFLSIFSKENTAFFSECVIPPLECPNKNVTFWLYTRANVNKPVELKISDPKSITSAPWVKDAPIKILIHGYTGYRDFSPNTELRPVYMDCCNYNVISVDYNNLVLEPCYMQAAKNTELTGLCTAQLIDELVQKYGFSLPDFHVIGFSLGGQTAGFIANYLKSGKLDRITALDPALPLFATADAREKVDSSDAHFVDILHTNALQKGKLEDSGHVDCYANGGVFQPGCVATENKTKSSCEHDRAVHYYAESITTTKGFYATKCHSWMAYILGWCEMVNSHEDIICGEHAPRDASGSYFFKTNSKPPYALGSRKNFKGKE
ncbi:jg4356 [Pararge aegeria aegeria]|uniref:Jg4356 protein n=1 Tax=Pararge aegeria aegeria TaxID=348720 RepID=A0A8S4RQ90_9NEOP|nr:jg4356 [Pararge aegeria aegeria]